MVGMTIDVESPRFIPRQDPRPNSNTAMSASLFHLDVGGVNGGFGARPSTALGNLSWMRQVAAQWQPSASAVEAAHLALTTDAGYSVAQKRLWALISDIKALSSMLSPADYRAASVHLSVLAGQAPPEPHVHHEERPLSPGHPGRARLPLTPRSPATRSPLTTRATPTVMSNTSPTRSPTQRLASPFRSSSRRPGSAMPAPILADIRLAGAETRPIVDDGSAVGKWVANRLGAVEQQVRDLHEQVPRAPSPQTMLQSVAVSGHQWQSAPRSPSPQTVGTSGRAFVSAPGIGSASGAASAAESSSVVICGHQRNQRSSVASTAMSSEDVGVQPARLGGDPTLWEVRDVSEWLRLYAQLSETQVRSALEEQGARH